MTTTCQIGKHSQKSRQRGNEVESEKKDNDNANNIASEGSFFCNAAATVASHISTYVKPN